MFNYSTYFYFISVHCIKNFGGNHLLVNSPHAKVSMELFIQLYAF